MSKANQEAWFVLIGRSQGGIEGSYFYQLIIEKDETVKLPSVQQLLRRSFLSADIKLAEVRNSRELYLFICLFV